MENLKNLDLVELSHDEMQEVSGGFWLQALIFVASAIIGYIFADNISS